MLDFSIFPCRKQKTCIALLCDLEPSYIGLSFCVCFCVLSLSIFLITSTVEILETIAGENKEISLDSQNKDLLGLQP